MKKLLVCLLLFLTTSLFSQFVVNKIDEDQINRFLSSIRTLSRDEFYKNMDIMYNSRLTNTVYSGIRLENVATKLLIIYCTYNIYDLQKVKEYLNKFYPWDEVLFELKELLLIKDYLREDSFSEIFSTMRANILKGASDSKKKVALWKLKELDLYFDYINYLKQHSLYFSK